MISISSFLHSLIKAAEKGASVAQIIRSDATLLKLLIQEKQGKEKNERFVQDFKTLADVLIQEMVRHDLSLQFPGIEENVYGEESNVFTNASGTCVHIQVQAKPEDTASMLVQVLGGDDEAASILSKVLHVQATDDQLIPTIDEDTELQVKDIGIWIDPIDSTAQYIRGVHGITNSAGFIQEGLQCTTVLIGAFDKTTGLPIAGVCVQPFHKFHDESNMWSSSTTWGVSYKHINVHSPNIDTTATIKHKLAISASESESVKNKLSQKFELIAVTGAGYKILCCLNGFVDGYVLSKPTIYKWDCCGLHAVLRTLGGGITLFSNDCNHGQVQYGFSESGNAFNGILVYRSQNVLQNILQCLRL